MTAASEGHISIVRLFLQHNANTELKDSQGWKASDHAVIHGHHRLGKQLLFWLRDAGIPLQSGHVVSLWLVSPTLDPPLQGCQNKPATGAFHRLFWIPHWLLRMLVGQF